MMVFDNHQTGQQLQGQRGGHSSSFLKGTTELANKMNKFNDTSWDLFKVELTYDRSQALPSPLGMPHFETINVAQAQTIFANCWTSPPNDRPDFSGERVKCYTSLITTAAIVTYIGGIFSTNDVPLFDSKFDCHKIMRMRDCIQTEVGRALIKNAKTFQRNVVACWNCNAAEHVTETLFLGLIGLSEEALMETGAIALDLLMKHGLLVKTGELQWDLADDYATKHPYIIGDAKTIENITKFQRDIQHRGLSFEQSSIQAEAYLDALSRVMIIPGD